MNLEVVKFKNWTIKLCGITSGFDLYRDELVVICSKNNPSLVCDIKIPPNILLFLKCLVAGNR